MSEARGAAYRAAERAARTAYGRLLSILTAQTRDIAAAEDVLSDALAAALESWPQTGPPARPEAWLLTAARNRLRSAARRAATAERALSDPSFPRSALGEADLAAAAARLGPAAAGDGEGAPDERLRLMLICAHPAIDAAARAPLMLQCVLGLDASRIARAFLANPATMSQRLVRAKARIRDAGLRFEGPDPSALGERLGPVLDAIYAAFGQGWDALDAPAAPEALCGEAIWLARLLRGLAPDEPEVSGLLSLMLHCAARRGARRSAEGRFVPLDQQDPALWDHAMIDEAELLLATAAKARRYGRYQCEAAIQSVHAARRRTGDANDAALRTLYDLLVAHDGGVGAAIGRATVLVDCGEAEAASRALDALPSSRVETYQPFWVARAHAAAALGAFEEADAALARAETLTGDEAVRAHLRARRAALSRG